ncbi:MAG: hypothetical protein IJT59_02910 [Desulfovibrionaceae bacterium]|nr:hypothetical protein [Desulfovibrionaceae bacterium]
MENHAWQSWQTRRSRQLLIGKISAVFFLCAILMLLDGLQALVRSSSNTIVLEAGQAEGVSGPCPFQNPVQSDLTFKFEPDNGQLSFKLEGFFAGYLVGNGMWRGYVLAESSAQTGRYKLRVGFRGAPQARQTFDLEVYATFDDLRAASYSKALYFLGLQPFWLAAILGGVAMVLGIFTYLLGRRNLNLLLNLGFAEIFRTTQVGVDPMYVWCSAQGAERLKVQQKLPIYSTEGELLGQGSFKSKAKNVLCLSLPYNEKITSGCLVRLTSKTDK